MPPKEFAQTRLGLTMWPKFNEIFDAVAAGHRRILVRSANGVGKTTALAALCNWKLSTCEECIVLTTSSNEKQLKHNLWGEIRRQAARAELYEPKAITDTRIKLDDKRFMVGINPAKPESAQGYHAASILIAIDEATAVRRDIIESLIATATGDDIQIVMIYNPLAPNSFVYEAERSGQWKLITISAAEHPNVTEDRLIIPGAVTRLSTMERLALWSEPTEPDADDAVEFFGTWWRRTLEVSRRILGQWYDGAGEGLISRELLNESLTTDAERGPKCMGVDLAFGGADETVIARFDGGVQLPFLILHTRDHTHIADVIAEQYKRGFTSVAVDETGAVGAMSILLSQRGVETQSVHFAQRATRLYQTKHRTFGNARMDMYFHLQQELSERKLKLVDDTKLHEELASVRLAVAAERETYFLEPKPQLHARLGRSPDRADATALARYALVLTRPKMPHLLPDRDAIREFEDERGWTVV